LSTFLKRKMRTSRTVTVVTDISQEIFGYDKYTEVTSEYANGIQLFIVRYDEDMNEAVLMIRGEVYVSLSDADK
jgi:hypothetical protein